MICTFSRLAAKKQYYIKYRYFMDIIFFGGFEKKKLIIMHNYLAVQRNARKRPILRVFSSVKLSLCII